jgi:hypothetical protein
MMKKIHRRWAAHRATSPSLPRWRHRCKLGATDADLADAFEVSVVTIGTWKAKHPDFLGFLKAGKAEADARVERSLYQRGVGYSYDAVKIFMPAGAKKPIYAPYRRAHAARPTSMIFWLKNRDPERGRDAWQLSTCRLTRQLFLVEDLV